MSGFVLDDKHNPIIVAPAGEKIISDDLLEKAVCQLGQIYRQIPKPDCNRCGNCCDGTKTGNPLVYSVEYWNITRFLNRPANKLLKLRIYGAAMMYKALARKKVGGEKSGNHSKHTRRILNCPAVDSQSKLCLIYEYRPFDCRRYGLRGWAKGAQGWVRQGENAGCDQVKISADDRTEHWNDDSWKSLCERIKQLSDYYCLDETKGAKLKAALMVDWLTLRL